MWSVKFFTAQSNGAQKNERRINVKNELKVELNNYLKNCALYYDLPGIVLGASVGIRDFNYKGASGYKDIRTKEVLHYDDIFHMASLTKPFAAMAILMLVDQGKLKLSDKMIDIIKTAPIDDKRYEEVTIEHILTHTSGIFESKFSWEPSSRYFSYQDETYDTLGLVIKEITGINFSDYVNKNILLPLNMCHSEISVTTRKDLICGHQKDKENKITGPVMFEYCEERAPSSTLTSNLSDMEKWANEVLVNKTLLSPKSYDLMFKEHAKIEGTDQHMCISWFKREQAGHTLYGHFGSDEGYRTCFWICPKLDIHISVMSNITTTPIRRISEEVFDMLLTII